MCNYKPHQSLNFTCNTYLKKSLLFAQFIYIHPFIINLNLHPRLKRQKFNQEGGLTYKKYFIQIFMHAKKI